jgi:hypothetical protein
LGKNRDGRQDGSSQRSKQALAGFDKQEFILMRIQVDFCGDLNVNGYSQPP